MIRECNKNRRSWHLNVDLAQFSDKSPNSVMTTMMTMKTMMTKKKKRRRRRRRRRRRMTMMRRRVSSAIDLLAWVFADIR